MQNALDMRIRGSFVSPSSLLAALFVDSVSLSTSSVQDPATETSILPEASIAPQKIELRSVLGSRYVAECSVEIGLSRPTLLRNIVQFLEATIHASPFCGHSFVKCPRTPPSYLRRCRPQWQYVRFQSRQPSCRRLATSSTSSKSQCTLC